MRFEELAGVPGMLLGVQISIRAAFAAALRGLGSLVLWAAVLVALFLFSVFGGVMLGRIAPFFGIPESQCWIFIPLTTITLFGTATVLVAVIGEKPQFPGSGKNA
jgi:hypothetical protein